MTVDDCIDEYKSLGGEIFGNPRVPSTKYALIWHRFSAKRLEKVIQDVTSRHSDARTLEFEVTYPSDEALCRT